MVWFFGKKKKEAEAQKEAQKIEEAKKLEEAQKAEQALLDASENINLEKELEAEIVVQEDLVGPEPEPEPEPEIIPAIVIDAPQEVVEEEPEEDKKGWFKRLTTGLSKSSNKITQGISDVLTKRKLDDELLEELEDILIVADLGPRTAAKIMADFSKDRFGKDVTDVEVKTFLADAIETILKPVAKPLNVVSDHKPHVILMTGVNGAGKTTTIGKIGRQLKMQGKSVMMAAGDTFRAAAVEQLTVWGERSNIPVFAKEIGSDAAALVYEAYAEAKKQGVDVLLVDTAGRLQNKLNLMQELEKIVRVMRKLDETAPHDSLIVLDATTGQNAHSQLSAFKEAVDLTGMIVTKLDGSAKGGVIVSLADQFNMPIHAVGVGETIDDLKPFTAREFALSLMGLEE